MSLSFLIAIAKCWSILLALCQLHLSRVGKPAGNPQMQSHSARVYTTPVMRLSAQLGIAFSISSQRWDCNVYRLYISSLAGFDGTRRACDSPNPTSLSPEPIYIRYALYTSYIYTRLLYTSYIFISASYIQVANSTILQEKHTFFVIGEEKDQLLTDTKLSAKGQSRI